MQEMQKEKVKEERRVPVGLREELEPPWYGLSGINRWFEEPFREIESVSREPLLYPFGARMGTFPMLRPWVAPSVVPRFGEIRLPLVDVEDKGPEFLVIAELPGIPKESVEVNATEDGIEIRAKVQHEEENKETEYYRKERFFKELYRHLRLPAEIMPDEAEAKLENGLLKIVLPKKEPTQAPKKLKVKVG